MSEPGPLLASGRSADIHEYGDGRVLRRRRPGPIHPLEPAVMRAVRAAGYPAPEVFEVEGHDMVLERVVGVDMLKHLERHPWRARRLGAMLAELHRQLAAIPVAAAGGEAGCIPVAFGDPEAFVHGDLHPGNVILTTAGPVVIDWEGGRIGPRDADVAITWLLLEIADVDDIDLWMRPIAGLLRSQLRRAFLAGVERPRKATIRAVCQARLDDRNLRAHEHERIRQFRDRHG